MTKRAIFLLFCMFGFIRAEIFSQNIIDTLEMAYTSFNQKDYQSSAIHFDYFLSKIDGYKEDYYLAAVCHARLGNKEKCLSYIDKAVKNKADYFMVLNDSLLKIIHPETNEIIRKISQFDESYKQTLESRRKEQRSKNLYVADSLYRTLPSGKIDPDMLVRMAEEFNYFNDISAFFFYMNEAAINIKQDDTREYIFKQIRSKIDKSVKEMTNEQLIAYSKLDVFRLAYCLYKYEKSDTAGVKNYLVTPEFYFKSVSKKEYLSIVNSLIYDKNYQYAFKLLYSGMATGRIGLEDIVKTDRLETFFEQAIGKSFFTLIMSEQIIPTIENADRVFISSSYEYSSSKREKYNYLKSTGFNSELPRLKKHLVSKMIDDPQKTNSKVLAVSFTSHAGLLEDELEAIIDTNGMIKRAEKDFQKFFKPQDEVVLVKNKPDPAFTVAPGAFYIQPVENIPFIMQVKNGKIRKSRIYDIRKKYFGSLVPFAIQSYLKEDIDESNIKFIVLNLGYEHISSFILNHLKTVEKEELPTFLRFIHRMDLEYTNILDFVVQILGNTDKYYAEENKRSDDSPFKLLNRLAEDYIENLDSRKEMARPFYKNRVQYENINKDQWKDAAVGLSKWWEEYKKANPFVLPPLVKSNISNVEGTSSDFYEFFINSQGNPVFYSTREKEVYKKPEKEELETMDVVVELVEDESSYQGGGGSAITGEIAGDAGCLFSPNAKDRPHEMIIVPGLTETELSKIRETYLKLHLNSIGVSQFGNYEKSYDRFFVHRFNDQLMISWFDDLTIKAAYLNNEVQVLQNPATVHYTKELKCDGNNDMYSEMIKNVNTLKFETIGDKILILCNLEVKNVPNCKTEPSSKIYLKLLDKELNIKNEYSFPDSINLGTNPATQIKVTNNYIYLFVSVDTDSKPIFYASFNKELKPVEPLTRINDKENLSKSIYTLANTGDDVFLFYPVNRNDDNLLAFNRIVPGKKISKTGYLYASEGGISFLNGKMGQKEYTLYFSENLFKATQVKKMTIPIKNLDLK